jgi:hypothetical protein
MPSHPTFQYSVPEENLPIVIVTQRLKPMKLQLIPQPANAKTIIATNFRSIFRFLFVCDTTFIKFQGLPHSRQKMTLFIKLGVSFCPDRVSIKNVSTIKKIFTGFKS